MSQMPDKIWLHKHTKYNMGDIVSAYQYEFAQEIECEGIENFVEYVPVDAFIDKVCEWLLNHNDYLENPYANVISFNMAKLVADFRKSMKGK